MEKSYKKWRSYIGGANYLKTNNCITKSKDDNKWQYVIYIYIHFYWQLGILCLSTLIVDYHTFLEEVAKIKEWYTLKSKCLKKKQKNYLRSHTTTVLIWTANLICRSNSVINARMPRIVNPTKISSKCVMLTNLIERLLLEF